MDNSGHLDDGMSQPGSHRNSQQFPQGDHGYGSRAYGSLSPPQYDPRFAEMSQDHQQQQQQQQQQHHHTNNRPTHQFDDYPLYSAPEDYPYRNLPTAGTGINPADLSLMDANNSSSHQPQLQHTPSHQLEPTDQDSPGHQQAYLSSSTQPSSTGGYEWETVFADSESWHAPRAPSEYSDISSVAPSPYLGNQEFGESSSPLLEPQYADGSMQALLNAPGGEAFGMDTFTLTEREPSPGLGATPGYPSANNSPFLHPQDNSSLGLVPGMRGMMGPPPPAGHGAGLALPPCGLGIHEESAAPQISVSFAPPQRQPTFPGKPGSQPDDQALRPPPKSPRSRPRSKSDPYANGSGSSIARSQSGSRGTSPVRGRSRQNSLSPADAQRSTSTSSTKMSRRSSTNSVPDRGYILGLAHPDRPGSTAGDSKRVQKHPATFQCHLCPKRFTRAYNLRSHLRTHTDERPFVCTICGKAFARQHDRKRHEGLHSGEKKFVCRGNLKAGGTWGCGRRFARADALGRHFRSEAGRVCIRPLLDEETAERQRTQMLGIMNPVGQVSAAPDGSMMETAAMGIAFPVALLEQYPALATMSWDMTADAGGGADEYDNDTGFDASGGEYDEGGSVSGGSAMSSQRNSYDGSRTAWGVEGWHSDTADGQVRVY